MGLSPARRLPRSACLLLVVSCAVLAVVRPAGAVATTPSLTLTARAVVVGAAVAAGGTVTSDGLARSVQLQFQTPAGWTTAATGSTDGDGSYRLRVPTDWYNAFVYRVDAPAVRGLPEETTPVAPLTVSPAYPPGGGPSQYSFTGSARWNPCRPVTWVWNPAGMPPGGLALFARAFAVLHAATGIRFRYLGITAVVPMRDAHDGPYDPRAMITIAASTPSVVRALGGDVIGLGGNLAGLIDGVPQVVQASVMLDAPTLAELTPGFGRGTTQGALVLHELGHVMGLGHSTGALQMMFPALWEYPAARYGAGDLAGLRLRGAAQGCLATGAVPAAARRTTTVVVDRWVDRD